MSFQAAIQQRGAVAELGTGAASPSTEGRRWQATELLRAAQEAVSVKGLIDLRGRGEQLPPAGQAAVAAVASLVAGIDDGTEAPPDVAPYTWQAAVFALQKPGHFVNSLRRFLYSVDAGRLPESNVSAAKEHMAMVSTAEIEQEGVVQHLYVWLLAALDYYEVNLLSAPTTMPHIDFHAPAPSPASELDQAIEVVEPAGVGQLAPQLPAEHLPVVADAVVLAADARPAQGALPAAAGTRRPAARAAVAGPPGPQRGTATATATSTAGRLARPGVAPRAAAAPRTAPSGRRGGYPGGGAAAAGTTGAPANVGGPSAARRSQLAARVSAAPSPMQPALRVTASRKPVGISGGSPQSTAGLKAAELRLQIEQLQRETREMRGMETSIQAKLRREEELQRQAEREADQKERLAEIQREAESMKEYAEQQRELQKQVDLEESRDFQEWKRFAKEVEHHNDIQDVQEAYQEHKEDAEYRVQVTKARLQDEQAVPLEANLEKYRLFSEHAQEEQRREEQQILEDRQAAEQQALVLKLEEARRERELALESVDYARGCIDVPVPVQKHLPTRVR